MKNTTKKTSNWYRMISLFVHSYNKCLCYWPRDYKTPEEIMEDEIQKCFGFLDEQGERGIVILTKEKQHRLRRRGTPRKRRERWNHSVRYSGGRYGSLIPVEKPNEELIAKRRNYEKKIRSLKEELVFLEKKAQLKRSTSPSLNSEIELIGLIDYDEDLMSLNIHNFDNKTTIRILILLKKIIKLKESISALELKISKKSAYHKRRLICEDVNFGKRETIPTKSKPIICDSGNFCKREVVEEFELIYSTSEDFLNLPEEEVEDYEQVSKFPEEIPDEEGLEKEVSSIFSEFENLNFAFPVTYPSLNSIELKKDRGNKNADYLCCFDRVDE